MVTSIIPQANSFIQEAYNALDREEFEEFLYYYQKFSWSTSQHALDMSEFYSSRKHSYFTNQAGNWLDYAVLIEKIEKFILTETSKGN